MANNEHEIRIISGKYKGKLLPVLDAEGLRPTPSRVRETIFSWLSHDIENANVLDLFSGSGALGFEALSRGAANVTLVELNKSNCNNLKKLATTFNTENIKVFNCDAVKFLEDSTEHFDVVFIDPPYKLDIYKDVLSLLIKRNLIDENSTVYVEMRNGSNQAVPGYQIVKEQSAGQSKYAIWNKSQLLF